MPNKNTDTPVTMEIINSEQFKRANIRFNGKPSDEIREKLKKEGWFYSRNHNVWYPKNDAAENSQTFANHIKETYFPEDKNAVQLITEASEKDELLANETTTLTVSADTFKEMTKAERFEKEYDENTPAYEKMLESQYNDFFKPRDNTANNFRHNLSVYCRKEANSPLDALKIAKEIVSRMDKEEQKKTKRLLEQVKKDDQSINECIVSMYFDAINTVPLNEEYIKDNFPDKRIARPFYDTISSKGMLVDPLSSLRIGDTIKNIPMKTSNVFGKGKSKIYENLTIVSASKEGNNIILMDNNKSFYELPRDEFLEGFNKQQIKQHKAEKKHQHRNEFEMER